ncbi:threonine synthase [Acidaminobacter sp. JC074]|uniref:threonine synthase n=1 Tax=Acidaminobacter sp. JC074 TaxID=2530199 RepID=UPI001F0FC9D0|nr:threonine synthase [Acidaminobacter sp. JC074]MCH4888512.1 threonine synthase [Acidaminobacter sp. JC074]
MLYKSTRGYEEKVSSASAIVNGIAPDGGLYIPESFPKLDLDKCLKMNYQELASYVLKMYLTDYSDAEVNCAVYKAYDEKFVDEVVPVKYLEGRSVLELYHGRTLAFKDMALSILPHLMKKASKKLGVEDEIVILTATSGDTGKAALEGFCDVDGTKIVVFYPSEGISEIQKHQMVSQKGDNTYVFGIKGNFDDAQSAVKSIFLDDALKADLKEKGYQFSSANSINIGRLVPQIVYYVHGYLDHVRKGMLNLGDFMNVVVPTGNFGNILASRYAKEMGLPIDKLICASNENAVLTDFIKSGTYDLDRKFKVTNSPSMDILISSNLERYLAFIGEDVPVLMNKLKNQGSYTISPSGKEKMKDFYASFATERETVLKIKEVYEKEAYLMDTHTAVAQVVYDRYLEDTSDDKPAMIASTASPYKFTRDVLKSISDDLLLDDDFELIHVLAEKTGLEVPEPIKYLAEDLVLHPHVISKVSIKNTVETILR